MYGGDDKYVQDFDIKPEGKRPLKRPKHRYEDFKMNIKEPLCEDVD
jgi:hypothetical protein